MAQWHEKSRRKSSGGLRKSVDRATKKLSWKGRNPTETTVGEQADRREVRERGGQRKVVALMIDQANVVQPKTNKTVKMKILRVKENPSNRDYARRNVVTKGAIIDVETEEEEVKQAIVTNRPGQNGSVHAKLIEEAS